MWFPLFDSILAQFWTPFRLLCHTKVPISEQTLVELNFKVIYNLVKFHGFSDLIYWKHCDFLFFLHISALYWPILDIYGTLMSQFQRKYELFTSLAPDFVDWCYVSLQVGRRINQTTKLYWVNQLGPLMPKGWKSTPCQKHLHKTKNYCSNV